MLLYNAGIFTACSSFIKDGYILVKNGKIIVGKTSSLLGSSAAMLLNALKEIAGIDDSVDIIDPLVMNPVEELKKKHLGHNNARLHLDEALLALAVSAPKNPEAAKALACLEELRGCECHSTLQTERRRRYQRWLFPKHPSGIVP